MKYHQPRDTVRARAAAWCLTHVAARLHVRVIATVVDTNPASLASARSSIARGLATVRCGATARPAVVPIDDLPLTQAGSFLQCGAPSIGDAYSDFFSSACAPLSASALPLLVVGLEVLADLPEGHDVAEDRVRVCRGAVLAQSVAVR